ncbi:MAG: MATE family efflux transporter [Oscillospiraceae bacterium]|nr:MATE family efflux transporter [Oscillospiraceae bacterium]
MDEQEQKFIQMTQPPVEKLICRLAVPCIISMLVTSFYNMADTFFVGMLDSNAATAAVGVVFSMMAVIQAVGFFFGHGSGNYISRQLGKKNYDEASNMAATGFYAALAAGVVICVLGLIFLEPLAYLLGSTKTILPYAKEYLGIILLGAPWMTASLVLNNQLRYQGSAIYAMVGIVFGAVLNIALDPLLIFTCHLGVAGAGWATIISQFVSFVILYIGCSKGSNIHIHLSRVRFRWFYFKKVIQGGLPSLARQCLASVATICLNHAAGIYGNDAAIAAMGVVQRIMMFGASAMIGFGQGFQPVCGFNFGAGLHDRVKRGFWFCVKSSLVFLVLVSGIMFLFAPELIVLFRDDPAVIECGAAALRFQCISFPAQSWIVMSNMMEQSMNRTVPATFLATARQGVFFIPAVLLLPLVFGLTGIQMAQMAADILTLLCAIPIHIYVLRTMDNKNAAK